MKDKPLKERIRELLDDLCHNTMGNPPYRIDQALQAILTEIKEGMPEKKIPPSGSLEDKYGYLAGQRKGWNAYHDEVEKKLEE